MKIKELIVCAMAMALGFIASYIKIFVMPFGGAVTLFSMFFVCLIGYWYGLKAGILGGFAYGVLQFLQEPYAVTISLPLLRWDFQGHLEIRSMVLKRDFYWL